VGGVVVQNLLRLSTTLKEFDGEIPVEDLRLIYKEAMKFVIPIV
jgi:hypothetical protein